MPRRLLLAFYWWLFGLVAASAAPWPAVDSDLPPDPAVRWGTLPNGLRYAIMPNAEPKERVSLRLLVSVGSLQERDDELGLAHFVEHMAFRGTRSHPNGSLTPALQRLGLGLGPDSTAFTHYDYTIYHLELPNTAEATLLEGLRVFREYASEVTFDEPLIDTERGVILSEKATRDTPDARNGLANLRLLFPESRQVRRVVIGTEDSIRHLTRERFVGFYDAWYRPDRMAMVIVGGIDPAAAERLVVAEFGGLAPRGPPRAGPDDLIPAAASPPNVGIFSDSGLLGVGLAFEHPVHQPRSADTHERRVHTLHEALAFAMFQNRLEKISHEPDASFVVPGAGTTSFLPDWRLASLTVSGKIDDWQQVAADTEREHRRAFQSGFTAHELEEARAVFTIGYEQAVRGSPTRPSDWLAGQLADSIVAGAVFATPGAVQHDLAAALAAASPQDCLTAFREAWTTGALHVFVSANPAFRITRPQIAAALNGSRKSAAPPRAESAAPTVFAYEDFGAPGRLVRDEHLADLDVRLAAFANGVRCNFKSTNFDADLVEVRVRVGGGKLLQPKNQPGLDLLANAVFTAGGLGRHTAQELRDLLAGRTISVGFETDADALVLEARCARRDLPLGLQIIAAYLTDAAYRPEALREANARFGSMFASLAASPGGPFGVRAMREILGGDKRFGLPTVDELLARNLTELVVWLDPQLKHGAIELSIVGDVTWEEVEPALARTLGALPKRDPRPRLRSADAVRFAKPPAAPRVFTIDPKLNQCAINSYWPVPGLKDVHEERRCVVLTKVLTERLRVRLREELGAAYSPAATFVQSNGFTNLNYFSLYAEVEPTRAAQALQIIQRETAALASKGPDDDEFTRARQPYLHEMNDSLQTNVYWGANVLADAQEHPARLAAARDRAADILAITRADVAKLARRHLTAKNTFTFLTVPAVPPPGPGAN